MLPATPPLARVRVPVLSTCQSSTRMPELAVPYIRMNSQLQPRIVEKPTQEYRLKVLGSSTFLPIRYMSPKSAAESRSSLSIVESWTAIRPVSIDDAVEYDRHGLALSLDLRSEHGKHVPQYTLSMLIARRKWQTSR